MQTDNKLGPVQLYSPAWQIPTRMEGFNLGYSPPSRFPLLGCSRPFKIYNHSISEHSLAAVTSQMVLLWCTPHIVAYIGIQQRQDLKDDSTGLDDR
jgi:hypothetical protein